MKRLHKIVALIMLVVYLTSIGGYAVVVLSCHCTHYHSVASCSCHACKSTHCENFALTSDGTTISTPCDCKHSHSTEIALYDYEKSHKVDFSAKYMSGIILADRFDRHFANSQKRILVTNISLPPPPAAENKALRAPPTLA